MPSPVSRAIPPHWRTRATRSAACCARRTPPSPVSTVRLPDRHILPGLANGKDGELFQKVKSIRELAESFDKRSAVFMEEGRRTLLDISEGAHRMDRKFEPEPGGNAVAPGPGPKRP